MALDACKVKCTEDVSCAGISHGKTGKNGACANCANECWLDYGRTETKSHSGFDLYVMTTRNHG